MAETTHISPADIFADTTPDIGELEHRAKRHIEDLDGLRKTEAYHTGQIEHFGDALAAAEDALGRLPADAGAQPLYAAKLAVIKAECERGAAAEELASVQSQFAEEQRRAEATAKALATARAELGP